MKYKLRKTLLLSDDTNKRKKIILRIASDIHIDIYDIGVISFTGEEAIKYADFYNNELDVDGITINKIDDFGDVVVLFKDNNPTPDIVVHEMTHATQMILMKIGHNFYDTDEPFAYLLSYLIREYCNK